MAVILEVLNSETNLRRVQITRSAIIGRGRKCGLRIASSKVSRQHCELILKDDSVEVRDLGSSNGTFVNNKPLVPRVTFELDPDDELRLGSVRLKVCFSTEPEANAEPEANDSETDQSDDQTKDPETQETIARTDDDASPLKTGAALAVGAAAGAAANAVDLSDEDETAPAEEPAAADSDEDDDSSAILSEVAASEPDESGSGDDALQSETTNEVAEDTPEAEAAIDSDDSFALFTDEFSSDGDSQDGESDVDDSSIMDFLSNLD